MDWFRRYVTRTTGPDWLRIPADLRGHNEALLAVCAQRENGGVLVGAADWSNRDWDRVAGMTLRALPGLLEHGLIVQRERDFVVVQYDPEDEVRASSRSRAGKVAAEKRWLERKSLRSDDASRNAPRNAEESRVEERRVEKSRVEKRTASPTAGGNNGHSGKDHQEFIATFTALWREATGKTEGPTWGGKQGAQVKRILAREGLAVAVVRAETLFRDPPAWLARGGGVPDIGTLEAHFDKLAVPGSAVRAPGGTTTADQWRAKAEELRLKGQ